MFFDEVLRNTLSGTGLYPSITDYDEAMNTFIRERDTYSEC